MQTSLMFVDLQSQGFLSKIDKIAIKMPKGQGDLESGAFGGFADMINALMASVPEDELQKSLDQLEWVPVEEGGAPALAPLIDLTQEQLGAIGMTAGLVKEAAAGTLRQTETLKSVLFPSIENSGVPAELSDAELGLKATAQGVDVQKSHRDLTGQQIEPMRAGFAKEPAEAVQKPSLEAVGEMNAKPAKPSVEAEIIKPKMTGGEQEKEMPPVLSRNEGLEKENRVETTDRRASRIASAQLPGGGQTASQGENGQQFSGNPEQKAMIFEKQDPTSRVMDDTPVRDFKPGIVENSLETAKESSDPMTKGGAEVRETQPVAAKVRPAFGERMDVATGAKETAPNNSQETQNNVIRQIVQRMTLQTQGSQSTMTIKLKPEFLGHVQMQISTDQQQVVVRMATESLAVKEMVEQGLQHLKTELQQHGLEIDKFDVFVADDNEDKKPGQDWAGFRQALKRRQRDGQKQGNREAEKAEATGTEDIGHRETSDGTGEIDYFA